MELDNRTQLFEALLQAGSGELGSDDHPWSLTFTLDGDTQFLTLALNATVDASMIVRVGGGLFRPAETLSLEDYLDSPYVTPPYQSFTVSPFMNDVATLCTEPCTVLVEVRLAAGSSSSSLPVKLTALKGEIAQWDADLSVDIEPGSMHIWGLPIVESDLPVYVRLTPGIYGQHELYLYESINPLQYFYPAPAYRTTLPSGQPIEYLWESAMLRGTNVDTRSATISPIAAKPSEGGNAAADRNYITVQGKWEPTVYLIAAWTPPDVAPNPLTGTTSCSLIVERQFTLGSPSYGLSLFGIIAGLTVLVLCLFSAAAIFVRRRNRAALSHAAAAGMDDEDGVRHTGRRRGHRQAMQQRRQQFDRNGRPIRYDAQGHIIHEGAKAEQVAALPTFPFDSDCMGEEDAHCTICLVEYEVGDLMKRLKCAHTFHSACIVKWLMQRRHCPLCQQDIESAIPRGGHAHPSSSAAAMGSSSSATAATPFSPININIKDGRSADEDAPLNEPSPENTARRTPIHVGGHEEGIELQLRPTPIRSHPTRPFNAAAVYGAHLAVDGSTSTSVSASVTPATSPRPNTASSYPPIQPANINVQVAWRGDGMGGTMVGSALNDLNSHRDANNASPNSSRQEDGRSRSPPPPHPHTHTPTRRHPQGYPLRPTTHHRHHRPQSSQSANASQSQMQRPLSSGGLTVHVQQRSIDQNVDLPATP